jgi:hypothetical protein
MSFRMFNLRKLAQLRRCRALGIWTECRANLIIIHIDALQPVHLHEDQIELSNFLRSGYDIIVNFRDKKVDRSQLCKVDILVFILRGNGLLLQDHGYL